MRIRKTLRAVVAVAASLFSTTAYAYPTGVVFTPTGEAKPAGTVGVMAYASTNLAPAVSPGATWFGAQVGLLAQVPYGKGLRFGGLEMGFDTISPYGNGIVKPVLNAKLGFVTEGTHSPAVAAGIMQVSPALPSMNFIYLSGTKTLRFGDGPSFGRFTLGLGGNAGRSQSVSGFSSTTSAARARSAAPTVGRRSWSRTPPRFGLARTSRTIARIRPPRTMASSRASWRLSTL